MNFSQGHVNYNVSTNVFGINVSDWITTTFELFIDLSLTNGSRQIELRNVFSNRSPQQTVSRNFLFKSFYYIIRWTRNQINTRFTCDNQNIPLTISSLHVGAKEDCTISQDLHQKKIWYLNEDLFWEICILCISIEISLPDKVSLRQINLRLTSTKLFNTVKP